VNLATRSSTGMSDLISSADQHMRGVVDAYITDDLIDGGRIGKAAKSRFGGNYPK
jgi:hypothetical protein